MTFGPPLYFSRVQFQTCVPTLDRGELRAVAAAINVSTPSPVLFLISPRFIETRSRTVLAIFHSGPETRVESHYKESWRARATMSTVDERYGCGEEHRKKLVRSDVLAESAGNRQLFVSVIFAVASTQT